MPTSPLALKSITRSSAPLKFLKPFICLYKQWKQTFLGFTVSVPMFPTPILQKPHFLCWEGCVEGFVRSSLRYLFQPFPTGLLVWEAT